MRKKEQEKKACRRVKVKMTDKVLWNNYLAVLGVISSLISLVTIFVAPSDLGKYMWWVAVPFAVGVVALFFIMWYSANHKKRVDLIINNTNVTVAEGNIWELYNKEPEQRLGEISVIGANDFFDDIVDNRIVSAKTLHGQYINRLNADGKLASLKDTIKNDRLLNKNGNVESVPTRPRGNQDRYRIGSLVEFESYVLAAFSSFNADNEAWLTAEEYMNFWMRFWENIDKIYAGRTINIPLMGAGLTRFRNGKPSKQELLEVMLWSLKVSGFHNTYADRQINFIIYSADVPEIDFYHIQHNRNFR